MEHSDYAGFIAKAQEFYEMMGIGFTQGKYDAAASAGIHCSILAADACLIFSRGYKCSSSRHLDLVPLVEQLPFQDAVGAARHLGRILDVKSLVEYTGDSYTEGESRQIVQHVERFFAWTKMMLPR